jgi:adenylosuccinate lyase
MYVIVIKMIASSIDRYSYSEMNSVFTEEAKLQKWLDVEVALAWAHAKLGTIPEAAAEEIERKAKVGIVKVERVNEIEKRTKHDLLAMVYALQEVCGGNAGSYIHLGATSSDIVDTALALQIREAMELLEADLKTLLNEIQNKAKLNKNTDTCYSPSQDNLEKIYEMKFALWSIDIGRHLDRLVGTRKRILVGKMNGAIGTMASFGDKGFEIQNLTMDHLGLGSALITNQIIQRDRHAELQCLLALISATVDKMSIEIYNLLRIRERLDINEPWDGPNNELSHEMNLVDIEEIRGLSQIVWSTVNASLESIALEHERDISNSSMERINIPKGFILTDYILHKMIDIIRGFNLKHQEEI